MLELEDKDWALEWISLANLKPIIEAIDVDASGLITAAEMNRFTMACPEGWRYAPAFYLLDFPSSVLNQQRYDSACSIG